MTEGAGYLVAVAGLALTMAARPPAIRAEDPPPSHREALLAVAAAEVGTVEKTGRNDGEVEKYIAAVGLNPKGRHPYCAAYVYWVGCETFRLHGHANPYPRSAWSPDFATGGTRITADTPIEGGEAGTLYYPSKRRVGHVFICRDRQGAFVRTYEGNTSMDAAPGSAADREGQGVHAKRRHWRTIHKVRDFIR